VDEEVRADFINALVDHGSSYAACNALGLSWAEVNADIMSSPEFMDAVSVATEGCIGRVTARLYHIANSEAGLDGRGGGVVKAAELFLKHHGALKDVSHVELNPMNLGLADIAKAVDAYPHGSVKDNRKDEPHNPGPKD
jgi:hypothetical protein